MALNRRLLAGALAGTALAVAAVSPALAYWRASGSGTSTVPAAAAAANRLTLALTTGTGHTVKASGAAGSGTPYGNSVSVALCKVNTFPCPANGGAVTLTATVSAGTYSVTSGNLNGYATVYGQASQLQTSGWRDYSTVPPVVNP